ncbi:hypothetical protein ABR335_00980 [Heyndrickxia faecalis]|uniref:Uncharacterized protein n=1 Tax=Heyndrickxia faecalis TaxID=2824910 RepID=A0AAU7WH41_9BACI
MRRYINLLVIVVAVVAAIPFFYTALAADKDPGLMLKKISGNEKEIRNVKITALDNQEEPFESHVFDYFIWKPLFRKGIFFFATR